MIPTFVTPPKNEFSFYIKTLSGMSGWLSESDILYLMDYILLHDTIIVEDTPNIVRGGIEWYGVRVQATSEELPEEKINHNGKIRTLKKVPFKHADTQYYFKHKDTRDSIRQYWK
jgi:hypothetical protein